MTYTRFALTIVTSTIVMFVLMYLNTYALEHVFFSETRVYMAILMGATMALVMLAFMASMYPSRIVNACIFAGSLVLFGLSLWLVRSQSTVNGESYMRAMIPHHSIAIMTSQRAGIEDARVAELAESIARAQRKEISEMRALAADLDAGRVVQKVYEDPAPRSGTLDDALNNTLLSELDLAPLSSEAAPAGQTCAFRRTRAEDPILISSADGSEAVVSLNGVTLPLEGRDAGTGFATAGLDIAIIPDEQWRFDDRLTFRLDPGPTVAYGGDWSC
ncbi:DUF305 domain-containing protein [Citreicella sp. C3M06]|uniref:DUF305 domain-containing protein n=1 Tax=Citreicella sp. C3M06 TaxID=2841564 RepID=UPI001C0917C4|nr:DUF305 domain-containing protein [Citreicella sp. C3M06]MBU2961123.1 DUF305 domain-containing protein [Citreicella sp. C3M06]